jgi:hypothetical protein
MMTCLYKKCMLAVPTVSLDEQAFVGDQSLQRYRTRSGSGRPDVPASTGSLN